MHTEAMVKVRVGYGNRVHNLQDIAKSYQEAKMALEVGRIFYAERETIAYSLLGIGRLIYQLPMSLCAVSYTHLKKLGILNSERKLMTYDEYDALMNPVTAVREKGIPHIS